MSEHSYLLAALLAGIVLLLAHAGYAIYATGLARAKNAAHTMSISGLAFPFFTIGFFICGFALRFGGAAPELGLDRWLIHPAGWNLLAGKGFFLTGFSKNAGALGLFFLAVCRLSLVATMTTGALAERWRFKNFLIFSILIGAFVAPIYASWVWGGGWIAQLGNHAAGSHGGIDYAGSSVIHLQAGAIALITAWLLAPRIGKFDARGRPRPILGHNMPMAILGSLFVAIALLALNCSASLAAGDSRVMVVAVNSLLAASAGALTACIRMTLAYGKPDPTVTCNGLLAGLVAIAASCAYVQPWAAVIIGVVAGLLVVWAVAFWEKRRIDDPAGVISVHGVNGLWGLVALGIFADGSFSPDSFSQSGVAGLFYGDAHQLLSQCVTAAVCIAWCMIVGGLLFQLVGKIFGPNRVRREVELSGLDIPELGVPAYRESLSSGNSENAFVPEPRPAALPVPASGNRFSIIIEGVDSNTLIGAWSGLCRVNSAPPFPEFTAVYPYLTTVTGNRFRFSGGDPARMKDNLHRLFERVLPDKSVSAKLES